MKRKILNQFVACVSLVTVVFAAGCGGSNSGSNSSESDVLQSSGYKLVDNGMTEYQIVLPDAAKAYEYTAAQELQTFIKKSTGADLAIVSESKVPDDAPVISIGETKQAAAKNLTAATDLASSGYSLTTKGDSLYILSDANGTGEGCIYGVYDVLEDAIGWRSYAADEVVYEEKSSVELYAYDVVVSPTFDRRAIAYLEVNNNEVYRRRMRLISQYNNDFWCNPLFGHSQVSVIMKKDKFYAEHKYGATKEVDGVTVPDHWYCGTGEQLCWTGGAEMEMETAKILYNDYIKKYPNAVYFMLGQEDTKAYCWCDRCQEALNTWGYNQTGLEIAYVNNVIKIIDEWMKEDYPEGRDVRYVIFGYHDTLIAPVKTTTDENGNETLVAASDKVVPDERLYTYFAPIETNYSKNLEDPENEDVLKALYGWDALFEGDARLIVYTYDTNFSHYFYNFDNFDTFQTQAKTYSEHGVNYFYSQGAVWTNQCTFQEMRVFVESNLMWDMDQSYDDLVNEFMGAFYKDAAPAIRKYYDFTRMRYKQCETLLEKYFDSIYANIGDKSIWTAPVVSALDDIFAEAYDSLAHYETENPELYKTLVSRVKRLELTVTYTKLTFYRRNYSQAELNRLIDEFNQYTSMFSILDYNEMNSCGGMFDDFRK